jgi:hypothetical protein
MGNMNTPLLVMYFTDNRSISIFTLFLSTNALQICPNTVIFFLDGDLLHIQGVSRLVVITAGGDFLGLCDKKISYKNVSDFGWLWSYDRLKL